MVLPAPVPTDDERRKGTATRGGVVFNPWVNIVTCVVITLGSGAMTLWFTSMLLDTVQALPYPDQGLDTVGGLIGVIVMGLVTLVLVGVTIFTIIWWARKGWRL